MSAENYFGRTPIITIGTTNREGVLKSRPDLGVLLNGSPYIRNAHGDGSRWYRRLQRTRRATFVDSGNRYAAEIENVDDERVLSQVDAAYRAKYADAGSSLRLATSPDARHHTMRVALDQR